MNAIFPASTLAIARQDERTFGPFLPMRVDAAAVATGYGEALVVVSLGARRSEIGARASDANADSVARDGVRRNRGEAAIV